MDDTIWLIVVEESANDAELILNSLRKARYPIRPRHIEDEEDLQDALTEHQWDLIISVPQVGEFTVAEVCEMVNLSKQDIPVVALTDKLDSKNMAELFKAGVRHVVPAGNDTCLQLIVGKELADLADRRKRRHLEQLYKESQRHNKMLLETSRDAIAYVHDGMHIHANPSYLEMFGYASMDELEGLPIMDLVPIESRQKFKEFMRDFMTDAKEQDRQIDLEGLTASNERFKIQMEVGQAIYDSERCVQVIIRTQSGDDGAYKLDPLTDLYNRSYFMELLEKALGKAMETGVRGVLFYIVLDRFNAIKESVGLGGSDLVIKSIGTLLSEIAKEGILARFADNAFTLLLMSADKKQAAELAKEICKSVQENVNEVDKQSVITTCSIGIDLVLASSTASVQDVLDNAALACQQAVKKGGNTFEIYVPIIDPVIDDIKIKDIIRIVQAAIAEPNNSLSLRYQPVVSLHGETQEIYEVFLRMTDEAGSMVPTGKLFQAAEQSNLTIHLDKWVLKEAVKVLMTQQKNKHETFFFVKLSDQAIKDENVLLYVRKLLKETQLSGEHLTIEISESTAISQIKLAKAFITSLNAMGCKSALEHFGTGLNSATTLKHLPVDYVKMDSSFSKGLSSNQENQNSVKEIVKMVHDLGKHAVAEAVEDADSMMILWQCEVDFVQGHYIQEPTEDLNYDFTEE
jgi:diguanylate cyclase (GGDEF)-like protein/PAS domain S-box-containing protein